MQLILFLAGCGSSGPSGTLVWVSEADGSPRTHIGSVAEGRGRPLIEGSAFPAAADPRGQVVLLVTSEDSPTGHVEQLALVPVSGGEAKPVGPRAQAVRNPAWSPDGSWIVFESSHESFRDLYRVDRDGSGLQRLTAADHGSFEPAVGPDGRIAFVSSRDGNAELYVMGSDGSKVERLTNDPTDDMQPAWSPDGKTLTWLRRQGTSVHLWKRDAKGETGPFVEPVSGEAVSAQQWSPSGQHVAITVNLEREVSLQVVGTERVVIDGAGPDEHPTWSADGAWLVFSSAREGSPDLYRVRPDGSGLTRITSDPKAAWLPRWIPAP